MTTKIKSLQEKIQDLHIALDHAKATNNHRLVVTLTEMINSWSVKGVKSSTGNDMNTHLDPTIKPIYNTKKASIKLKAEKYDVRISAPSPQLVARRLRIAQRARLAN